MRNSTFGLLLLVLFYNPLSKRLWTLEGADAFDGKVVMFGDVYDYKTSLKGADPYYVEHWRLASDEGLVIE